MATNPPTPSAAVLALQRKEYKSSINAWQQYMDLFEGENIAQYLFRHLRESQDSLNKRKERVHYLNYLKPVIELYTHYVYSKPIVRKSSIQDIYSTRGTEGDVRPDQVLAGAQEEIGSLILGKNEEDSEWTTWHKDVDSCGNSIDRFMSDNTKYSLLLGHVFILIDLPSLDAPLKNELERQERGHRPYLVRYYPTEVPNWAVDEFGKLLWIRFKEPLPESDDPFKQSTPSEELTTMNSRGQVVLYDASGQQMQGSAMGKNVHDGIYRTWTKNEFFVHKVENGAVELQNSGTHKLNEVPVVPMYSTRSMFGAVKSVSLIRDIARINVSILNWSSLVDEEMYQKTLNILCISKGRDDQPEIVIGSHNAFEYEGAAPFFLAPSSDPGAFIASQIDRAREEIYRIAKLGGGLGLQTPQQTPSGISQAFEFNETNRTLAEVALEAERAEQEIHRIWHKWMGKEFEGTVDYPDDFSVESFKEELDAMVQAKTAIRSPTFKREMEKKTARKMLRNVNPMIAAIVEAEIEILPEIVMGPFGPQYVTPGQPPGAVDTNADEISQSPFSQTGGDSETATAGDTAGASAGTSPGITEGK